MVGLFDLISGWWKGGGGRFLFLGILYTIMAFNGQLPS